MILTTPTKVCAECGAGWERVTEREIKPPPDRIHNNPFKHDQMTTHGEGAHTLRNVVEKNTLGFRPTCSCGDMVECDRCHGTGIDPEDEPEMACYDCIGAGYQPESKPTKPAVILDLFCGTGTVCWQADQLGRDWIGIDIDPKSIKMAEERLRMGPVEYEMMEERWIQPQLTIGEER